LHPGVQQTLAVHYAILEGTATGPPGFVRVAEQRVDDRPFAELWRNERPVPRAWIVDRVIRLEPLASRRPAAVRRRTQQVLFDNARVRDLRTTAVVEMPSAAGFPPAPPLAGVLRKEGCRIVVDQPQRVQIDAQLASPGLLLLSDFYDEGWRAVLLQTTSKDVLSGQHLNVVRTNRVMRGVWLPAGRHRVEFCYRPREFYAGAALSIGGWLALLIGAGYCGWQSRRSADKN
jgi:hypothetical protein